MYHDREINSEEITIISELREKFGPFHDLDLKKIRVEKYCDDQLYLEFNYNGIVSLIHHAYNEDILAEDIDGSPLGIALFHSDTQALTKMHIFRYDGDGDVHVKPGSIRFF